PPDAIATLSLPDALPFSARADAGEEPSDRDEREDGDEREAEPAGERLQRLGLAARREPHARRVGGGKDRVAQLGGLAAGDDHGRSEVHTSELQSRENLVC